MTKTTNPKQDKYDETVLAYIMDNDDLYSRFDEDTLLSDGYSNCYLLDEVSRYKTERAATLLLAALVICN